MIETATDSLASANCIQVGSDEISLEPLNLGLIAVFYCLKYSSIEIFNHLITPNCKHRSLLTAITSAVEIEENVQIRMGEETALQHLYSTLQLSASQPNSVDPNFTDPHLKAMILLTAHVRREALTTDLQNDLAQLLVQAQRFVQALVDVVSSNGFLTPAIAAMELSQMLVQATVTNKSSLLQLPGVDEDFLTKAEGKILVTT